jgi:hypothetical protein
VAPLKGLNVARLHSQTSEGAVRKNLFGALFVYKNEFKCLKLVPKMSYSKFILLKIGMTGEVPKSGHLVSPFVNLSIVPKISLGRMMSAYRV